MTSEIICAKIKLTISKSAYFEIVNQQFYQTFSKGDYMSKKTLYKLFYIDKDKYKEEFEKRFNSSDTVHLNFNIGDNPAFFCQSPEIYKLIVSIERIDKEIWGLCSTLPEKAIEQFRKRCLIDEIVITNNIEGVHSTRREINSILQDLSSKDKKQRFFGLVNKYNMLIKNEDISINSCEDIRKIYDDIFLDEIKASDKKNVPDGRIFRKETVDVYSETQKVIHNGVYPEEKIINLMQDAIDMLNNENIDMLFRIAIFHYLFGYIHPFYDGNGRTSRFISSYLLSKCLNRIIGFRISYTIKDNLKKYYDAFKICNHRNNKGDLTPFIEMFLSIIDDSQKNLCEALRMRYNGLENCHNQIALYLDHNDEYNETTFKLYEVLVEAALFSEFGISTKELQEYMNMSYNTLKNRLGTIPDVLLNVKKENRTVYYSINLDEFDKAIENWQE